MTPMRSFLFLLAGSVLLLSGCADRPEVPQSAYGTILVALPELPEAQEPFDFPYDPPELPPPDPFDDW